MTDRERVILVDRFDRPVGTAEKLHAHVEGLLHRAFSVFLFDVQGRMLLQQRAHGKYHSGGLWSNACCSHPMPGESTAEAVQRRLQEELGAAAVNVHHAFEFIYRADVGGGLVEHELDHVYLGRHDGPFQPDTAEIAAVRWIDTDALRSELTRTPHRFTPWFHIAYAKLEELSMLPAA